MLLVACVSSLQGSVGLSSGLAGTVLPCCWLTTQAAALSELTPSQAVFIATKNEMFH